MAADEVSFRLRYSLNDPDERGWLFVPLSVGQDYVLEMLPNPFSPRSTISRRALGDLRARGLIAEGRPPVLLRDLRIVGQRVPDVTARVGAAPSLLRVDGILGFDFFEQFRRIIFDTQTRWIILSNR